MCPQLSAVAQSPDGLILTVRSRMFVAFESQPPFCCVLGAVPTVSLIELFSDPIDAT